MNFLGKRSQIPPPPGADHGRVRSMQPSLRRRQARLSATQATCSRATSAWSAVFQTKFKMADEADSSVSGEEGHFGKT